MPQLEFPNPGADLSPPAMVHFSKNTLHLWPFEYVMIFHVIKQRFQTACLVSPIDSEPYLRALAFPAFSRLWTMPVLTYLCSSSICQLLSSTVTYYGNRDYDGSPIAKVNGNLCKLGSDRPPPSSRCFVCICLQMVNTNVHNFTMSTVQCPCTMAADVKGTTGKAFLGSKPCSEWWH